MERPAGTGLQVLSDDQKLLLWRAIEPGPDLAHAAVRNVNPVNDQEPEWVRALNDATAHLRNLADA
jgi:hypothetical protein